MKVYMTKTWGFDEPCGPLQFGELGRMESARRVLQSGDLVAIVGTQGKETALEDRGQILGLIEPTTRSVPSLAFALRTRPEDYDVDGNYKWPHALQIRRAWKFDTPRRTLRSITSREFSMAAASGIVELETAEADAILALPRTQIEIMPEGAADDLPMGVSRKRAPPPATSRRAVMFLRNTEAYTYLMSVTTRSALAYKIGWAFDATVRARQFNRVSMPGLGGAEYKLILAHRWPTAHRAFHMEQWLLKTFDVKRHVGNSEILHPIPKMEIETAWQKYVRELPPLNIDLCLKSSAA